MLPLNFEAKVIDKKRTDYHLSFTGKNKETPLQVDVFKAMTNQRAITPNFFTSGQSTRKYYG